MSPALNRTGIRLRRVNAECHPAVSAKPRGTPPAAPAVLRAPVPAQQDSARPAPRDWVPVPQAEPAKQHPVP